MEAITTAFGTALGTVQSDFMGLVAVAFPYAIGIAGTFIAVKLGMRFFKAASK